MAADHIESLLCRCGPLVDQTGLHHREPPGPAVTRDELASALDPEAWLTYRPTRQARALKRADNLLARFSVHHLPTPPALPITNDAPAITARVLGDRRGELLRPRPGGERS